MEYFTLDILIQFLLIGWIANIILVVHSFGLFILLVLLYGHKHGLYAVNKKVKILEDYNRTKKSLSWYVFIVPYYNAYIQFRIYFMICWFTITTLNFYDSVFDAFYNEMELREDV